MCDRSGNNGGRQDAFSYGAAKINWPSLSTSMVAVYPIPSCLSTGNLIRFGKMDRFKLWMLSLLSATLSASATTALASISDPHVWQEGVMTGDWSSFRNVALSGAAVGVVNFLIRSPLSSVIQRTTETHTVETVITPAPASEPPKAT